MFYYKKEKIGYFIWSDKIKGKFGPFDGIFCKNKILTSPLTPLLIGEGKIKELEKNYPSYKFSFGFSQKKIFIIGKTNLEKIL